MGHGGRFLSAWDQGTRRSFARASGYCDRSTPGRKVSGEGSGRTAAPGGRSFLNGNGVGRGRGKLVFAQDEDEVAVAHADLVTGTEACRASDLGAVEEGAVLGSRVVEFRSVAGMDKNGTMTTRDETILDDHVVIGRAADGVQANFE